MRKIAVLRYLLLFAVTIGCYAQDNCDNNNPYLQSACQHLQKNSDNVQQMQAEVYEKQVNENEKSMRQTIMDQSKPPPLPPPNIPMWQKALKPSGDTRSDAEDSHSMQVSPDDQKKTDTSDMPIVQPPKVGPTEYASPHAVTLPGGLNVIPIKPKDSDTIKYY